MKVQVCVCLLLATAVFAVEPPTLPPQYSLTYVGTVVFPPNDVRKEVGTFYFDLETGNWRNDGTAITGTVVSILQLVEKRVQFQFGYAPTSNNNQACGFYQGVSNNAYELFNYFTNATSAGTMIVDGKLVNAWNLDFKFNNGSPDLVPVNLTAYFDFTTGYPVQLAQVWPGWNLVMQVQNFQPSVPSNIFDVPHECHSKPQELNVSEKFLFAHM